MAIIIRNSAFLAISVFAVIFSISCSESGFSDWLDNLIKPIPPDESNILQNSNLGFMGSSQGIPEGDVDAIRNVEISGSVLSGGSVIVIVTSSEKLEELYLQIEGEENGYYVWTLEAEDQISSNPYVYRVDLEFNIDLEGGEKGAPKELIFTVSGKTESGDYVKQKQKRLKIINAGSGALQVSLSWDKDDDVDLHVFSPSGEDLYFANPYIEATGKHGKAELDIDSNAGCEIDGINSENIFFEAPLEDGDYKVEVHIFEKCKSGDGAKYRVTANLEGKFVEFSKQQSGQFKAQDDDNYKIVVGTIKIRNSKISN